MIRLGIIGTGNAVSIANAHYKGILEDNRAELTAVLNSNFENTERWVRQVGGNIKACKTFDELVECVDAIIICSPNNTHLHYAGLANKYGKNVLIEKPLSVPGQSIKEFTSIWNSDIYSQIGLVYRYSKKTEILKEIVENKIGKIYLIDGIMGGCRLADPTVPMEWRMKTENSGYGALCDFGYHLIDIAKYACNQKYEECRCNLKTVIKERCDMSGKMCAVETDDMATLTLSNSNGLANFTVSRVGVGEMRICVVGEGGSCEFSYAPKDRNLYYRQSKQGSYTLTTETISLKENDDLNEWFIEQIKDFLNGIEGKNTRAATLEEGLYIHNLIENAEKSLL